ncbi:MAG: hypothetical protein JWM28_2254 [Chitinophagaceae bacterium]|nr:hypothetical protein [Chitinophagaceae bacterium]
MKNILKLEEMVMLALSIYAMILFHADWWWWLLLLFGPDISLFGYLAGNKTGAACYNLFHHKAFAIAIFIIGLSTKIDPLQLTGIILFGHSSMDRMLGYGLKLKEGFKFTHLGIIGKK